MISVVKKEVNVVDELNPYESLAEGEARGFAFRPICPAASQQEYSNPVTGRKAYIRI
jgi:hypothetical protein